jgi:hypothetical protein
MQGKASTDSARRAIVKPVLFTMVIAALGTSAALYYVRTTPCTILVEGKPIASVESRVVAKKALAEARRGRAGDVQSGGLRFAEEVTLRAASKDADLADLPEAVGALENATTVQAELWAISVDGVPTAGLRTRKDAEKALDLVKRHYESGLPNTCGESSFKGNVFVERRYVDAGKYHSSPEKACDTLTSVIESPIMHVVQSGDRAVYLAEKYDISLDELQSNNPNLDLEQLTEGESLVIRRATQPITVISKALVTKTVVVMPPSEAGRRSRASAGKRTVRMLVTYENGAPAGQELISQITTWDRPKISHSRRSRRSKPPEAAKPSDALLQTKPSPTGL